MGTVNNNYIKPLNNKQITKIAVKMCEVNSSIEKNVLPDMELDLLEKLISMGIEGMNEIISRNTKIIEYNNHNYTVLCLDLVNGNIVENIDESEEKTLERFNNLAYYTYFNKKLSKEHIRLIQDKQKEIIELEKSGYAYLIKLNGDLIKLKSSKKDFKIILDSTYRMIMLIIGLIITKQGTMGDSILREMVIILSLVQGWNIVFNCGIRAFQIIKEEYF